MKKQAGVWVKASEKTPIDKRPSSAKSYYSGCCLKIRGINATGFFVTFNNKIFCDYKIYENDNNSGCGRIPEDEFNDVEWLDEQPIPVKMDEIIYDLVAALSYNGFLSDRISVQQATERIKLAFQQPSPVNQDKNFTVRLKAAIDKRFVESGLKDRCFHGASLKSYKEVEEAFFDSLEEITIEYLQGQKQQPIPVNQDEGYVNPEYKDLFEKRFDYSNYEQLAEDVWLFLTDDSRPEKARIKKEALIHEVKTMIESAVLFRLKDFEEVQKDHARLVRELDVLINGENGAAKQASLCDIVAQLKSSPSPTPVKNDKKIIREFAFEIALRLTDTLDTVDCSSFSSVAKAVEKTLRQTIFIIGKDPTKTYEPIPDEQPPTPVQEGLREDESFDWKTEYECAVREIQELQSQLKSAEKQISELEIGIRNSY